MGLLDLPSPLLSWFDGELARFVPTAVLVALWGAAGGLVSMELYRLLSPQQRIARLREKLAHAQAHLNDFDGPFEEAWQHIRRMLSLALRRVGLVLPSTLIASLPVLVLIVWMDARYGETFPPPGQPAAIEVEGNFQGRWVEGTPPSAEVLDPDGTPVADIALPHPAHVVHKWRWWNLLAGNPAGYLPADAPFDHVEIAMPGRQVLPFGPGWLRGWEPLFLISVFGVALAAKILRRIE